MSSSRRFLLPGESTVFTTRVASQTTLLFAVPPPDPGAFSPHFSWHKELCCEEDHEENAFQANISAAGALVTVRNLGNADPGPIQVFTDYI